MNKRGLIFDLDGTLWDACPQIADSWNEYILRTAPQYGIRLTEHDLRRACGLTMKAIGDLLFPQIPEKERDLLTEGCCEYEVEYLKKAGGDVYDGVRETLERLKADWHLYIVSNCQVGYVEDFLDWSRTWDLFEDFENFGRTGKGKADNIRLLCERNGLTEAVYVGDTQGDCDSAMEAGVPFLLAAYGFGHVKGCPRVSSFRELPEELPGMGDIRIRPGKQA